jgi:lipopolysaccharide/colanic/teichoic acid biosynthesis glycosyltransferase
MSVETATSEGVAVVASKPYSVALINDLLQIFDVALIFLLGLTVHFFYVYPQMPHTSSQYLVTLLIATIIAGLIFNWLGLYSSDVVFTKGLRAGRMLSALAVSFALFLAIAFALKVSDFYSRVWLTSWFLSSAAALTIGRFCLGYQIEQLARRGRFAIEAESVPADKKHYDHHILGGLDDLIGMIRNDKVDQVFIALPWNEVECLREVSHRLAMTPVAIRLAPDLAGFEFPDRSYAEVAGLPMLPLFDRPISGWSQYVKVIEDRVLAALFLLLFSAVLLVAAVVVRLTSKGPVLFKQKRYGFNNQLIEIWKFRTMYHDLADQSADTLVTKNDDRVTPVGRFLRRSSIDELPQLFNVLRGDMSIVGPRPHAVSAKAGGQLYYEVVDKYAARHKVKPGITGWAQVNGWRGETSTTEDIQKRVEHDLYYIDNWSIWFDLLIIAKTVMVLLGDEKAY